MKKIIILSFLFIVTRQLSSYSQEKFGDKLNVGLGIGYTGDYSSQPVLHFNYEFDAARNFTLAPFITFYAYDEYDAHHDVVYRESAIPIGVKGSYYFDQLFKAGRHWDFYGAGSLGFTIYNRSWDSGYTGSHEAYGGTSYLYIDLHAGARYHMSKKVGLYLDLSTGISTFGLSFSF